MAIRVSGLVSGLDTDSIVQELVSAYSMKKDKHVKAQTKLEWKMDAWKELNKKVNKLYKRLGNMKLSSYYNKKSTTISDTTKATVVAGSSAMNGTHTLSVDEVATTGQLTGAQLKGAKRNTTLVELGMTSGKGHISVNVGGATTDIEVDSNMTVGDFVSKLQEAGVSANFDETNGRFYISAKKSGKENDFAIMATDSAGVDALKSMGIYMKPKSGGKEESVINEWKKYAQYQADGVTLDEAATKNNISTILSNIAQYQGTGAGSIAELEDLNAAKKTTLTNLQAERSYATAYMSSNDTLKALNSTEQTELKELILKNQADLTGTEQAKLRDYQQQLGLSDEDYAQFKANIKAVDSYEKDPDVNTTIVNDVHTAYAGGTATMQQWVDQNTAGIESIVNDMKGIAEDIADKQDYIKEHAILTGTAPATDTNTITDRTDILWDRLSFMVSAQDPNYSDADDTKAGKADAKDATITLDGIEYTSATNDITVNGLTITALQKTNGQDVTITTQANVQGIYDSIKDFLKEYNALIKEMDELYNADSAKGYEPLTDDEKGAMTDKEIEKWEDKIKKSLLRRDDTLSTVMNLMTTSMAQGITLSDGKKYSLASFGIKTQGYLASAENEGNVFHIDGDPEDEVTAGNNGGADALMAAIQNNPEMVQEFFQKLSDDLYTKLDKKMQSSTMNSKFCIYNDKKMQKDYNEYSKTIKKWEEKTSAMEEYYYKKFAAMEKALSSLQSSTSALGGLLGS